MPAGWCNSGGFLYWCGQGQETPPPVQPVPMGPLGLPVSDDIAATWGTAPQVGPLVDVPVVLEQDIQDDQATVFLNTATATLKSRMKEPVMAEGDVSPAPCQCWKRWAFLALLGLAAVGVAWKLSKR